MPYPIRIHNLLAVCLVLVLTIPQATATPSIVAPLQAGKLAEAEKILTDHLEAENTDDLARFQLGTVQLLRAAEKLAQDGARYGTLSNMIAIPFVRLGGFGDRNANPEPVTYQDIRTMIADFQKAVAQAEDTLAPIQADDLYWELDFGQVALDLDGDGDRELSERLDALFRRVARQPSRSGQKQPIVVGLDSADVAWLRGYCHVLQALADMTLAYDHERLFELTAHAFFANAQTDYTRKQDAKIKHSQRKSRQFWGGMEEIADLIAAIHLLDFKLIEPGRMESAREHLLATIELSRRNWELIALESDNRNEWIPGPGQKSVIPNMQAGPEQVDAWHNFLSEAEAILQGEKLVPFWRSGFEGGVNVRRMFTEPRDFDLILWMHGSAALPYLEHGEQTEPDFWQEMQRTFRGRFLGFALWTN